MEQTERIRRIRSRKRKRMIRRMVIFIYRCICVGIVTTIVIFVVKLLPDIVSIVRGDKSFEEPFISAVTEESFREEYPQEEYPQSLLDLLERNPETKDFVLEYPENKDKDFEIDLSDELMDGTIPLFLQWDVRWGYETYGSDFMAITGCGPTCLSMVRCGLSGEDEWNPWEVAKMSEDYGFYVDGAGTSWDLMTTGATQLGLTVNSVIYDEAHIIAELKKGNPIICIMGPGDFTTSGHFIVLTGVDEEGKITVCDPNSRINSEKHWDAGEIIRQIRNLWGYTYTG